MATVVLYQPFAENLVGGGAAGDAAALDWLSHVIKAGLSTTAPTVSHETYSQIVGELATANGYTAGGQALTTSASRASGVMTCTATAWSWTASGGSLVFQYCFLYNDTPTTPADPLIGYIDCGSQTITTGNTFTITPGANGIFQVTVT